MKRIASILIVTLCCCVATWGGSLHHLRVNRMAEPTGILRSAQFSWMVSSDGQDVRQVAYAIRAAASPEALKAGGRSLLWDSGRVESGETLQVNDYSKLDWEWSMFDPEQKKKRRETVFPQERRKAFEMGKSLTGI